MDAMSSPSKLTSLIYSLKKDYPDISFNEGERSSWDAKNQTVTYNGREGTNPIWSLLHEVGHMKAGHEQYRSDIQLLLMESEAWKIADKLGKKYGHQIDQDYVQDCLDSYRDWLHRRSTCPTCKQTGSEKKTGHYICINCGTPWKVSSSRFCRVYRQRKIKNTA